MGPAGNIDTTSSAVDLGSTATVNALRGFLDAVTSHLSLEVSLSRLAAAFDASAIGRFGFVIAPPREQPTVVTARADAGTREWLNHAARAGQLVDRDRRLLRGRTAGPVSSPPHGFAMELPHFAAVAVRSHDDDAAVGWAVLLGDFEHTEPSIGHLELAADFAGLAVNHDRRLRSLTRRATHDELTELHNRGAIIAELAARIASGETAGVLYLDLDRFKDVNDHLGHEVGDQVLRAAAARLARTIRSGDRIGRLGGDEFAVVFAVDDHPRESIALAQRMIDSLAPPFHVADQRLRLAVSVGIARFTTDGRAADEAAADLRDNVPSRSARELPDDAASIAAARELIAAADHAMYRAKRAGTNSWALDGSAAEH